MLAFEVLFRMLNWEVIVFLTINTLFLFLSLKIKHKIEELPSGNRVYRQKLPVF